jgi:hypothetical protein
MTSIRRMRRVLACSLLVALVTSGSAFADHLDPQERFNRADQARARAMLLRKADFPPVFTSSQPTPDTHFTCEALDESDLTITGDAESRNFQGGPFLFTSIASVYATERDSARSWQRGTSAAGEQCLRATLRRDAAQENVTFVSFRRISFPRLAEQSVAYRVVGAYQGVRAFVDLIVMRHGRAQAGVLITSVGRPMPKAEEVRFARLVAGRMARAMG